MIDQFHLMKTVTFKLWRRVTWWSHPILNTILLLIVYAWMFHHNLTRRRSTTIQHKFRTREIQHPSYFIWDNNFTWLSWKSIRLRFHNCSWVCLLPDQSVLFGYLSSHWAISLSLHIWRDIRRHAHDYYRSTRLCWNFWDLMSPVLMSLWSGIG